MSVKQCAVCQRPLRNVRRWGRKKRYCSNRCRSAARRTRNFVSSGYKTTATTRNGKNSTAFSTAFEAQKPGRANMKPRLFDRGLWEAIIARETGLPRPPPGKMTVVDLRKQHRRPSFIRRP
jgi:hypothetical protein